MPAPVMHIVLSLLILPSLPDKDPKAFIIGASFPDVRYLGVIERAKTHDEYASWDKVVKEPSSCKAGMEFHALVDKIHDNYMVSSHAYDLLPVEFQKKSQYLKFFEDILIYGKCSKWQEVVSYFDSICLEELDLVSDKMVLTQWHNIIKKYIVQQPVAETLIKFFDMTMPDAQSKAGVEKRIALFSHHFADLLMNKDLYEHIMTFYEQFPVLLRGESIQKQNLLLPFL
jgi:hypothetical protein